MSDKIIQLNEDLIKHDLKDLVRTKNKILNSNSPRGEFKISFLDYFLIMI